jgi:hypothetical protein
MKQAVEMGSSVMIHIPSFIKMCLVILKLIKGNTRTHRQHGNLISPFSFLENKEITVHIFL